MWYLYPKLAPHLVYHVLAHDVPESLTGDVPSTAKDHQDTVLDDAINHHFGLPTMSSLSDYEHHVVKSCDLLDLYIWAKEQYALGNAYAQEIVGNLAVTFAGGALEKTANTFYEQQLSGASAVPERRGLLAEIKESYDV
jgi:5'-deoxynucleotidase YfbR-like HD superfamily hydrolase